MSLNELLSSLKTVTRKMNDEEAYDAVWSAVTALTPKQIKQIKRDNEEIDEMKDTPVDYETHESPLAEFQSKLIFYILKKLGF